MKNFTNNKTEFIQIIALIAIFIILIGVFAWKPLQINLLRNRAGRLLEGYIKAYAPEFEDYLSCQLPVITDLPADNGLSDAVALLEQAKSLRPQNGQTNLMLGRVYCLQGDYYRAIESFEGFSAAHPDNPLGDLENALAHFSLSITSDELNDAEKSALNQKSRLLIEGQGLSGNYFIERGDYLFDGGAYKGAWYWYYLAEIFQPLSEENAFRFLLIDQIFKNIQIFNYPRINNNLLLINNPLVTYPNDFFKVSNGNPAELQTINENIAAVIWSNNSYIGVLVGVENTDRYCITISTNDHPPAPTIIKVIVDFNPIGEIILTEGDSVWRSHDFVVELDPGKHLVGLKLTNDANINGLDRNGYIGNVTLDYCRD